MMKFRHILAVLLLAVIVYACGDDGPTVPTADPNFDHAGQALKDNDTIIKFLKSHYFDDSSDLIKTIDAGQGSLFNDSRLQANKVNEFDIDYVYYSFVKEVGNPDPVKDFPTVVDSVLVKFRLKTIDSSTVVKDVSDLNTARWFNPASIEVRGWLYGFTHFKGGKNITNNGPITYEGAGNGFFLLPSGLSYRNNPQTLTNKILLYYVNLLDIVEDTDSDRDGVPSILEDIDGDGKPWNDDTDGDNISDFLDTDDDGDGVLTIREKKTSSDPNNPSLPDYLNPVIRVDNGN